MTSTYEDRKLSCADCGREFVWTAADQKLFYDRGLVNLPKRCKDCRQAKKVRRGDQLGGGNK